MRKLFLGSFLAFLLAACSFTVTVDLPDQRFDIAAFSTQGLILYQEQSFSPPPLSGAIRAVRITGEASLEAPAYLTLELYGRSRAPEGCQSQSWGGQTYYLCPQGPDDGPLGQLSFSPNSPTQPLDLQGQALAEGIRQGQLWLGVRVQGGAVDNTLYLKNLKASITVGL